MRTFGTITELVVMFSLTYLCMIQIRPIYTKSSGTFVPFVTAMCPFMSPMFPFESQKCPRGHKCNIGGTFGTRCKSSLNVANVPSMSRMFPFQSLMCPVSCRKCADSDYSLSLSLSLSLMQWATLSFDLAFC